MPSLDWGQTRTDHVALYRPASTALCGSAPLAEAGPLASTPLPCTPEGRQTIRQLCREIPLQPWDMDVHRHSQAITDHLWRGLQAHFPVNKTPCRREYFAPETWRLRGKREWLRKRIHAGSSFLESLRARSGLIAWRTRRPLSVVRAVSFSSVLWLVKDLPVFIAEFRSSSKLLREAIRRDTEAHVQHTAAHAMQASTKDVVQRLRSFTGGPKRKQRGTPPLSAVELTDGSLAATAEAAKARWLEHFSAIEDGKVRDACSIPIRLLREVPTLPWAHLNGHCATRPQTGPTAWTECLGSWRIFAQPSCPKCCSSSS